MHSSLFSRSTSVSGRLTTISRLLGPHHAWQSNKSVPHGEPDADNQLSFEAAKKQALKIISRSSVPSRFEVEKKMVEKGTSPAIASMALDYLVQIRLQSDEEVAEVWVRSRWNQQRKTPSMIKRELAVKRIDPRVADQAIQNFFGSREMQARDIRDAQRMKEGEEDLEEEEEEEEERQVSLSRELLLTVRRKMATMQGDLESKKRRVAGWLMRRGHRWDVIAPLLSIAVTSEGD